MKHIKSVLALMLVVVLLAGCGASVTMEDLSGKWIYHEQQDQSEAVYLMDLIELYDAEQVYADHDSLSLVRVATFDAEGNYTFGYDVEATKACVHSFYSGVLDALYENRASVGTIYGVDMTAMTEEEFGTFYAEMYGCATKDEMLELFTESAYDYTVMAEPFETGTCKITGKVLMCTITGETEAESLGFELSDASLKLIFSDMEEVYTRGN